MRKNYLALTVCATTMLKIKFNPEVKMYKRIIGNLQVIFAVCRTEQSPPPPSIAKNTKLNRRAGRCVNGGRRKKLIVSPPG